MRYSSCREYRNDEEGHARKIPKGRPPSVAVIKRARRKPDDDDDDDDGK